MDKVKVKDENHLYRDRRSNAIVNSSLSEYKNYIESKKIKQKEMSRIDTIETELNNLKSDINVIKSLLMEIKNGSK